MCAAFSDYLRQGWRRWQGIWSADRSVSEATDAEIDEELIFHLHALVDECTAGGASADDAWRQARKRFGSISRYADACRAANHGDEIMFQRLSIAGLIGLALAVGWLLFEVRALRESQERLVIDEVQHRAALSAAATRAAIGDRSGSIVTAATEAKGDLVGKVADGEGRPLEGAKLLIILKTWPGGRYRQQAFDATSDEQGMFRLPKLVPVSGQFAVQIAAVKEGYALASIYELRKDGGVAGLSPIEFRLEPASPITLILHDSQGRALAKARFAATGRKTTGGDEHVIYFQACEPIQKTTDDQGRVQVECYSRGDKAEVYVKSADSDWKSYEVTIPTEGDTVELTTS